MLTADQQKEVTRRMAHDLVLEMRPLIDHFLNNMDTDDGQHVRDFLWYNKVGILRVLEAHLQPQTEQA